MEQKYIPIIPISFLAMSQEKHAARLTAYSSYLASTEKQFAQYKVVCTDGKKGEENGTI